MLSLWVGIYTVQKYQVIRCGAVVWNFDGDSLPEIHMLWQEVNDWTDNVEVLEQVFNFGVNADSSNADLHSIPYAACFIRQPHEVNR